MSLRFFKKILCNIFLFFTVIATAQELNCKVIIDADQVQTQEKQVFVEMQQNLQRFINDQQWTEDEFQSHEKIDCSIVIQLSQGDVNKGVYSGTAQIQSVRPVYNSGYETPTFSFFDKYVSFEYRAGQTLFFNQNAYTNNLTSILSFYAYMIIGYDYDSFSELGGTSYFDIARNVLNAVPQGISDGWLNGKDPNNRWGLMNQTNSPQVEKARIAYYQYHRLGMDVFEDKPKESQQQAIAFIKALQETRQVVPISIYIEGMFKAKRDEFILIFKGLKTSKEKSDVYNILRSVDPANTERYQEIVRN